MLVDVTASGDFREARRLFSAAVSHELRTPLARILGLAETLELPQTDAEREALVVQIEVEVDAMRGLIDEMLLLAALDRGESATGEQADAGAIAEAVVADRARPPDVAGPRPAVRRRARACACPWRRACSRWCSATCSTTRCCTPAPTRSVSVAVGARRQRGRDRGRTTPASASHPSTCRTSSSASTAAESSRAGPGTGLGLAVVKHIVEAHGGRVGADSRPGSGTTVRLTLPRVAAERLTASA